MNIWYALTVFSRDDGRGVTSDKKWFWTINDFGQKVTSDGAWLRTKNKLGQNVTKFHVRISDTTWFRTNIDIGQGMAQDKTSANFKKNSKTCPKLFIFGHI